MGVPEIAIETRGLVKTFGSTRAVDGVDLTVRRGGIYGVLGPNGAGKTTTIRMLATLLRPDAGEALTTQYLDEVDQLADRIAVIDHGKVIAEGSSGELKASVGAGSLHVRLHAPEQRAEAERGLAGVLEVQVEPSADPAALKIQTRPRQPDP